MNLEIKFKCNGKRLLPRPKNALMHPPAVPPHPPVAGASIGVRCRYSTPLRAMESWSLGKIRIISIYTIDKILELQWKCCRKESRLQAGMQESELGSGPYSTVGEASRGTDHCQVG